MSLLTDASSSSSPSQPEQQQATQPPPQPTKRSSRRANTAERRATHNAVERLRRETLNGRFLVSILFNIRSLIVAYVHLLFYPSNEICGFSFLVDMRPD